MVLLVVMVPYPARISSDHGSAKGYVGGHTKGASYRHFPANAELLGVVQAAKIARLEYDNIKATHAFAQDHNIACDLFTGDTVDIVYSQAQWEEALRGIKMLQDAMPDAADGAAKYELYTEAQAREIFHCKGSEKIYGAVKYQAGSLSAYKFVCGILEMCLAKGLQLHTNTPATSLKRNADGLWEVRTERSILTAKKVVLATNGYTSFLRSELQGSIVPLRGQITTHRPGPSMPKEGLETTYSFIYQDGYEYMISRPQGSMHGGDIVIGGGLARAPDGGLLEYGTTDDTRLEPTISCYLRETVPRYFGESWGEDDPQGRIRMEWTGIMGYSPDGFPFVGEMPGEKDLYISASFQGHGMVLCFLCAKALAAMISGAGEKGLDNWFPPAFKISEERMKLKFHGRLHTKAPASEVQAQLL